MSPIVTPDFSDRATRDVPTPERKAADADFLSRTGVPYEYQAAVDRRDRQRQHVGDRPSNVREQWARLDGTVHGIEAAVQGLCGYMFNSDVEDVLKMAIERLPAVEMERSAIRAERVADLYKANEAARRVLDGQELQPLREEEP